MATISKPTTAKQLLETSDAGRCELIEGELVAMSPAGFEHGRVVMRISLPLALHVESRQLGVVVGAETGFQIQRDPDTVRAPDVAFVRADRVPQAALRGFFEGPPDLAVEVVSPDDRPRVVAAKVSAWLAAGCDEVWTVNPARQIVTVFRRDGREIVLSELDEIVGEGLLAGFRLAVNEIFIHR